MTASAEFANITAHLSCRHSISKHCRGSHDEFASAGLAQHEGLRTGQPVGFLKELGSIRRGRLTVAISQRMYPSYFQLLTSWIEANRYTSNDLVAPNPSNASMQSVLKDEWYNLTYWLFYYSTMSTTSRVCCALPGPPWFSRESHCKKADCSRRFLIDGSLRDHEKEHLEMRPGRCRAF